MNTNDLATILLLALAVLGIASMCVFLWIVWRVMHAFKRVRGWFHTTNKTMKLVSDAQNYGLTLTPTVTRVRGRRRHSNKDGWIW